MAEHFGSRARAAAEGYTQHTPRTGHLHTDIEIAALVEKVARLEAERDRLTAENERLRRQVRRAS